MENSRISPCVGQRHLMIFLLMMGMAIVFMNRVNLSVTLVAMVNKTSVPSNINPPKSNINPSCLPNYNISSLRSITDHRIPPWVPVIPGGEFSWSRHTQGLVLSSYFWLYALPLIPVGSIAHKWSSKWIFCIGVMVPSLLSVLIPTAARLSVYALMVVRALQGFFESVTCPSIAVLLGRWCPLPEASVLYMIAMMGALVGAIFGQLTAGAICETIGLGWVSVFYIQMGISLFWLPAWYILAYNSPRANPRITTAEVEYIATRDEDEEVSRDVPWKEILRDPSVWSFILCMGVRDWLFSTNLSCLPQFLTDVLHLGVAEAGYVAAIPYGANLIFPIMAALFSDIVMRRGWLSRTNTRKLFSTLGLVGTAVCLLESTRVGCKTVPVVTLMVLANVVISLVSGGFMPNAVDLSGRFCGVLFSMSNILSTVACIVSPIVADELATRGTLKEWAIVFDIGSGLAIGSAIIFLLCGSGKRRPWNNEEKDDSEVEALLEGSSNHVNYSQI